MRKKILQYAVGLSLGCLAAYGLLQIDFVSHLATPKRYWRKKILLYQKQLRGAKKVAIIKQIQLKKKLMTSELDIVQDMMLGIDQGTSISVVQGELQKLKDSVIDSESAVRNLEVLEAQAREKFNRK